MEWRAHAQRVVVMQEAGSARRGGYATRSAEVQCPSRGDCAPDALGAEPGERLKLTPELVIGLRGVDRRSRLRCW